MGDTMNQAQKILDYMERNGSITQLEATLELGITRLGARIYDLKEGGVKIITENEIGKNRDGVTVHYARYRLERNNA
jgi:hypothetical protein